MVKKNLQLNFCNRSNLKFINLQVQLIEYMHMAQTEMEILKYSHMLYYSHVNKFVVFYNEKLHI